MRKIKTILLLGILFVLCCGFRSTDTLVFDYAGLLSGNEETLSNHARQISDKIQMQVVLLTTNDTSGQSTQYYVDHFGTEKNLGYTENDQNYIVFCIDMDNRQIYISTSGEAIQQITDEEIEKILSTCKPYASDGDYYGTCEEFLDVIVSYVVEPSFVQKVFSIGNILRSIIIGLIIAGIVVFIMYSNSSSRITANSSTYKKGKARISGKRDIFVHQTVTRHKIESDKKGRDGSSFHTDSSGTHGGGGMKF